MTAQGEASLMTLLRRFTPVLLIVTVLAPTLTFATPGAAQDSTTSSAITEADAAALGTTLDGLAALTPNPAWDDLGLFSADMLRVIEASSIAVSPLLYAFGDDPNGTPIINPTGATPVAGGSLAIQIPDDWTAPPTGVTGNTAFAETATSQLAPGDLASLMWVQFDSDYDFSTGLTINEGFPLTIPGLPVWNSSFAGDTWEGANVIPNAVLDGGVLTLDVKSYAPPESFPLIDIATMYYRSGTIMAMVVSAGGLADYGAAQGVEVSTTEDEPAAPQTLLYTGSSAAVTVQDDELTPQERGLIAFLSRVGMSVFTHISEDGTFQAGFIAYLRFEFGRAATDRFLAGAAWFDIGAPSEEAIEEELDDILEAAEAEILEEIIEDEEAAEAEIDDALAEILDDLDEEDAAASDSGPWAIIAIAIAAAAAAAAALTTIAMIARRRRLTAPADPSVTYTMAPDDDPRDVGPPEIYGEEVDQAGSCGWELDVNDGGNWRNVKPLAPGESPCCKYNVEVETEVLFHDSVASFRQDVLPERFYIPVMETAANALTWVSSTGTRSGPAGRQDWQHGQGNPVDQSDIGEPGAYWQRGQGEERPDVTTQMLHIELSRVKAWIEPGCTAHTHTFHTSSWGEVRVNADQECTNDNPGDACPVELNAYGAALGLAFGDTNMLFAHGIGTDIDELERHAEAIQNMSPEERKSLDPQPLPLIGGWDGHDHDTRDKTHYEHTEGDGEHPMKDSDEWEAYFLTISVHFAGQLVPVAVWPSTERVSTHIGFGVDYGLHLRGEQERPACGATCSGHQDRACHDNAEFDLKIGVGGSVLSAGGKSVSLARQSGPPTGIVPGQDLNMWGATSLAAIPMP
jgi:hypothetical protein